MSDRKPRRTFTIVGIAGGLAVAAAVLAPKPPTTVPAPLPPPDSPPIADSCRAGEAQVSRATVETTFGTARAALSGQHVLADADGEMWVSFEIAAREADLGQRPPLNVAIVVDHSGSMSGEKIKSARDAARGLVNRMGPTDRVALIQFDDVAEVLVSSTLVDDAGRARLLAAIETIQDAGGTNLGEGLFLGRDEVLRQLAPGAANRVILLSDGKASIGIMDTPTLARAATEASERGVRITAVGLGVDFNEDLMEALAEHGRGQYYFVAEAGSLEGVFAGEMRAIQGTVATRTEVRLEPACSGVRIAEVYGYEIRRDGDAVIIPLADVAGGDRRKIVARLEVAATKGGRTGILRPTLSFATPNGETRSADLGWLGVEVTGDQARVEATADREVLAKVEQVEGARAVRDAADAYAKGDRAQAIGIIQKRRAVAEEKAKKYDMKPADLAPVYEQMDALEAGVVATPEGAAPAPAVTKSGKASARSLSK
jgi:Ca-activated chloride channel homolog